MCYLETSCVTPLFILLLHGNSCTRYSIVFEGRNVYSQAFSCRIAEEIFVFKEDEASEGWRTRERLVLILVDSSKMREETL
jgi:hypothetical protein